MKKLLTTLAIIIAAHCAHAQATLITTMSGGMQPANVVLFSANGERIWTCDSAHVFIYTMYGSLYRTINIPPVSGYKASNVYAVSDHLFNSDDLIEVCVAYARTASTTFPTYKNFLLNETGSVLQNLDTNSYGTIHYNDSTNSYQLFTYDFSLGSSPGIYYYTNSIYSLPGVMPCGLCGNLGTDRVIKSDNSISISDPVPNPSSDAVRINYNLPTGSTTGVLTFYAMNGSIVKQVPVFSQQNNVDVNVSTLTPGIYTYNLMSDINGEMQRTGGKTLLVK